VLLVYGLLKGSSGKDLDKFGILSSLGDAEMIFRPVLDDGGKTSTISTVNGHG
jgi:hypothetical protein